MLELFRMDMRRLWAAKYLWVMPLCAEALLWGLYVLLDLTSDPEMLRAMAGQGAESTAEDYAARQALADMTLLGYLHQAMFRGNMWLLGVGLGAGAFCVEDHTHGALKNFLPLLGRRWPYAAARAFALLALTAAMLTAAFAAVLMLAPVSMFDGLGGAPLDWLALYVSALLLGWAYALGCALLADLVRGEGWTMVLVLVFSLGVPVTLLSAALEWLHLPPLADYTLFATAYTCVEPLFEPAAALRVALTGLCWGAVYMAGSIAVLERRDAA